MHGDPTGVMFYGMNVFTSPLLVETIMEPVYKTIIDRILEWNPCNPWRKPDQRPVQVPSSNVIVDKVNNAIYVHPDTLDILKKEIADMSEVTGARARRWLAI